MKLKRIACIAVCVVLLSQITTKVYACDVCGCGVGSYYLGILPDFNKRFIGFRYQQNFLEAHLGPTGNRTPNSTNETYRALELWGAWNFGQRWRAMAIVPYSFNRRSVGNGGMETGKKDGLGDVVLMGYYKLFDHMTTTSSNKLLIQSLWIGGGFKAPTGAYDDAEQSNAAQGSPNNFQLGTGSTDFMANAAYDVRLMDLGLNLNATYKINTENRFDYRYGNKLTVNALAYYKINIKNKVRIAPNVGIIHETQSKDVLYNRYDVDQSGGKLTNGVVGVEINMGSVSIGTNYQTPLAQDLAGGRIRAGNRFMSHVSFAF